MSSMRERLVASAVLVLLGVPWGGAKAEEAPNEPQLRVETGMHTAPIRSIATDTAGRHVVTGALDKTVRVWDAPTGVLLRTLRPPIAPGAEGQIFAVALSPAGDLVAAAGATCTQSESGRCIYLFDRETGRMAQRISGVPHTVTRLAFARDGKRLAAALESGGVHVFAMPGGTDVGQAPGCTEAGAGVDFDGAGSLVTSCSDGHVRLYDGSLTLQAEWPAPKGKLPHGVRFSPDGSRMAVGYANSSQVDVLSAKDLRLLYQPDVTGVPVPLDVVAWSADGVLLAASDDPDVSGAPLPGADEARV